ncbi:site-specific integrase [Nocardioides rotundus]|uniref:tyrosine-type recombinase/integrase n=1 Tax=Nocardioides rotundus TaxID=1774216 RepID=UPI001CBFD92C|nr:site-specific integrase [Nocardioides rotundus]UAL31243.1 site-specific integrase [Nocardioides rotundus]
MARPKKAGCPICKGRKQAHAEGIRHLPSKKFQARLLTPDGKQTSKSFQTETDAKAWLGAQRSEISKGTWSPKKAKTVLSFSDYAERWLKNRKVRGKPLADRTRAGYRDLLDRFILPEFGPRPVHTIDRDDVERWYDRTASDRPTYRAKAYSLLRTILVSAIDDGHHPGPNPARIRGAGQADRRHTVRPATLDELKALTEAMPERYRLMVQLATWTALRFGELTELRRADVDTREGVLRVRRAVVLVDGKFIVKTPKSQAGVRDVAIPAALLPLVREHLLKHTAPGPDGLLFPARKDATAHLRQTSLYRVFDPARKKAGRPDLRWHDLRHTGAVLAAQSGATLPELMNRLGHSTSQAALRYQHVAQGRDQLIASRLSELIEAGE